ncbi:MAG: hypothetical protein K2L78_00290, partial [Muribaculaceae bacterium]|nr:hypothetical protein [Muribaculaceae bacterium]
GVCVSSCGGDDPEPVVTPAPAPDEPAEPDAPEEPVPDPEPEPDPTPVVPDAPAECDNKVVAHRGGSKEAGAEVPDNSLASLSYAMSLGCYASECDIYITADKRVVVAHADSDGKVNGFYPYEATLDELRAAGTLSNGEQIPTLEEYLQHLMQPESSTRLWLDIKRVDKPTLLPDHSVEACKQACRIVAEMKAGPWVEFICTGNEEIMSRCAPIVWRSELTIGWMANRPVADYTAHSYEWANLDVKNMTDANHSGPRTVDEFFNAGVALSVYNVDKPKNMRYYIERLDKMKAICTNNPHLLLQEMGLRD